MEQSEILDKITLVLNQCNLNERQLKRIYLFICATIKASKLNNNS